MENTAAAFKLEDYVHYLLNVDEETRSQAEIAKDFGVSSKTLCEWKKKVDWDWVKDRRREKFASKTIRVDNALVKKAVSGDIRAIEVYYQRFDQWIPTTAQKTTHDLDESLVDDELKRLMQLRGDTAAVISNTVDNGAGKAIERTDSGEAEAKA